MRRFFITGTDTDVGKTYVTRLLARSLLEKGISTAIFKPIASGCDTPGNPASNPDLAAFLQIDPASSVALMNLWCFDAAIAPHIAAAELNQSIDLKTLTSKMDDLFQHRFSAQEYDYALIEGAGGWKLPLNMTETLDQWVVSEQLEVILVVGMKLGCINHALLTADSIVNSGGILRGWIANSLEPMNKYAENLATLKSYMPVPCLGEVHVGQTSFPLHDLLE